MRIDFRCSGDLIFFEMAEIQDSEDRLIRNVLVIGSTVLVGGLILVAVTIAVMVSCNFNFLQWME